MEKTLVTSPYTISPIAFLIVSNYLELTLHIIYILFRKSYPSEEISLAYDIIISRWYLLQYMLTCYSICYATIVLVGIKLKFCRAAIGSALHNGDFNHSPPAGCSWFLSLSMFVPLDFSPTQFFVPFNVCST